MFFTGLQAVFRTGLTIILLLESRIMNMTEEATVLPILLRVPVDVWVHWYSNLFQLINYIYIVVAKMIRTLGIFKRF